MAENPRIDDLRRRLDKEPGSRLFAQLAEELRKEGSYEESIRVARAGLLQQPNYPSARMTLGRALFDSGDLAAARVEFETVLRGAPDNILASRFLAECLEGLGDLGSALLQYRAALRLAPSDKNVEAQIRSLEQKLSAPTVVRRAPDVSASPAGVASPPAAEAPAPPRLPALVAAPPLPPPPTPWAIPARPSTSGVTSEVMPVPPARPAAPPPPEPEPEASPTLVEESFDLEAPFNAPTHLRAEEGPLPGRELSSDPDAPTLPGTPMSFDFEPMPLRSLAPTTLPPEPVLIPEPPPPAAVPPPPPPAVAAPRATAHLPSEPPAHIPPAVTPPPPAYVPPPPPAPSPAVAPAPPPAPARATPPAHAEPSRPPVTVAPPPVEPSLSPPAVPVPSDAAAVPPWADDTRSDTARVPVIKYPPPPPSPNLVDAVRLEWAPVPPPPPAERHADAPPPPPLPEPAPAPSSPPIADRPAVAEPPFTRAPSPVPVFQSPPVPPSEPLLSPTLAELYFGQGAFDQAIGVYEQLVVREPANEKLQARLAEVRRAAAAPSDQARQARRLEIEAQIARLEQLLTLVTRA